DGRDVVRHGDPAHPLESGAKPPAEAEPKERQHALEHAAVRSEHEARAEENNANAGVRRRLGRALPVTRRLGEEVRSRGALFVDDVVIAMGAIVADRRAAEKNAGLRW